MANKTTIRERLATLEEAVKTGFLNINEKLDNHLITHDKRELFQKRLILILVGIIGSLGISILIFAIKYFLMKG